MILREVFVTIFWTKVFVKMMKNSPSLTISCRARTLGVPDVLGNLKLMDGWMESLMAYG